MRSRARAVLMVVLVTFAAASVRGQQPRRAPAVAQALPSFDVLEKSIEDLQRALTTGGVTSRQLVDLYLARIERVRQQGPSLNAIIAVNPNARQTAEQLDAERAQGKVRGPLHGIPVS